jgi:hypothetical protein
MMECQVAVSVADAQLLAEACDLALQSKVLPETEDEYQKIQTTKAFFEVAAVLGAMQFDFPLDHSDNLHEFLDRLGLGDYVERVGRPAHLAAE